MKINIITCHDVYNYGASLQAYALQEYIRSLGHDVSIIDYKPCDSSGRYDFWTIPKTCRIYRLTQKCKPIAFLYCLYRAPARFCTIGRKKPFDNFKLNYLTCTKKYTNIDELRQNPPDADIYVAGSDQIWNTVLPNGKDPAFYMNFGRKNIYRVSYAASFAIQSIQEEYKPFVKEMLGQIDSISVREQTGKRIVNDLGFDAEVVCDPVFLRTNKQWEQIISKVRLCKEHYVLVYDLYSRDPRIDKTAREIAEKYGLKIVSVNAFAKKKYADRNINNAGPLEYLNYIYYSDCVITDSFHASAFSVMFHIPFYVYQITESNNSSRIADFLETIHLGDRLNPVSINREVNFQESDNCLKEYVMSSINFLANSL